MLFHATYGIVDRKLYGRAEVTLEYRGCELGAANDNMFPGVFNHPWYNGLA